MRVARETGGKKVNENVSSGTKRKSKRKEKDSVASSVLERERAKTKKGKGTFSLSISSPTLGNLEGGSLFFCLFFSLSLSLLSPCVLPAPSLLFSDALQQAVAERPGRRWAIEGERFCFELRARGAPQGLLFFLVNFDHRQLILRCFRSDFFSAPLSRSFWTLEFLSFIRYWRLNTN